MHNIAEGFYSGSNLEEEFSALYKTAETTRGRIAGFIKYLLDVEKKSKALKKPEKPRTVNREP